MSVTVVLASYCCTSTR